jgi:hypothetical protein
VRSEERVLVANEQLYSSAWSCRTGKRIKSSHEEDVNEKHTHTTQKMQMKKYKGTLSMKIFYTPPQFGYCLAMARAHLLM